MLPNNEVRLVLYVVSSILVIIAVLILEGPKGNGAKALLRCLAVPLVLATLAPLVGLIAKQCDIEASQWAFVASSIATIVFVSWFNLKLWKS